MKRCSRMGEKEGYSERAHVRMLGLFAGPLSTLNLCTRIRHYPLIPTHTHTLGAAGLYGDAYEYLDGTVQRSTHAPHTAYRTDNLELIRP